jgi:IPT/TIG domain-containing protein
MSRSQRHKVIIQGTDSAGKGLSEKQPALRYVNQYANSQAFSVWSGPPGGPLQGSSMVGFPPTLIPAPGLMAEREAEVTATGNFSDPGQFDNTGNPIHQDLPASNEPAPGPEPEPGPAPVISSINPDNAAIGDPPQLVNVNGSNFAGLSAVMIDDTKVATTFLSDTQLQVTLDPGDAAAVFTIKVQNPDGQESNTSTFTVGEPATQASRSFPIGPLPIQSITPDSGGGGAIYLVYGDVRTGDAVTIEATGTTAANGTYIVDEAVTDASGTHVVIHDSGATALIEAKGRLTVTDGTRS